MANTTNQQQAAPTMEQTLNQSEAFFLKYKKAIITVVVAIIVIIVGAVLYKTYIAEPNEQKASTAIAKGQDYFAQGLFQQALEGDSTGFKGFAKLADEYSSTAAGNLSNLYAGLCNAQLGKWELLRSSLRLMMVPTMQWYLPLPKVHWVMPMLT